MVQVSPWSMEEMHQMYQPVLRETFQDFVILDHLIQSTGKAHPVRRYQWWFRNHRGWWIRNNNERFGVLWFCLLICTTCHSPHYWRWCPSTKLCSVYRVSGMWIVVFKSLFHHSNMLFNLRKLNYIINKWLPFSAILLEPLWLVRLSKMLELLASSPFLLENLTQLLQTFSR